MKTDLTIIPDPRQRSRVENGAPFVEAKATSAWARRFTGLCRTYAIHIGGDPTPPQVALIRRIATIDIEAERVEGALAEGKPADIDGYARMAGLQRRLLEQIGFEASKRGAAPDLEDILSEAGR